MLTAFEPNPGEWWLKTPSGDTYAIVAIIRRGEEVGYRAVSYAERAEDRMKDARIRITRFDPPRVDGAPWAELFVGPSRDGKTVLEVFAHLNVKAQGVLIFHVMPARPSTLRRAKQIIEERRNPK